MSRGVGTPSRDFTRCVLCSSRIMSMQSSTHSSQMNTVGPAMSLRTSCWDLPQNEQYRVFFESGDLLIPTPAPDSLGAKGRLYPPSAARDKHRDSTHPLRGNILSINGHAPVHRKGSRAPVSASGGVLERGAIFHHLVHQTEIPTLLSRHICITLQFTFDCFYRLPRMPNVYFVEPLAQRQDLPRLDLDVRRLPLRAARRLVHHDPRIRQRKALALRTRGQQQTPHRSRLADAYGGNRASDVLHGVVDREAR